MINLPIMRWARKRKLQPDLDYCGCSICNENAERKFFPSAIQLIGCLGIAMLLVIASCTLSHANGISTYRAVNAIIGEAENQGYTGMLAVACAIRNRGTLNGVYGEHAPRVINRKFSEKTTNMAIKAWAESQLHDITNGATNWENIKAFGCPSWVKACVEVFRYKDHVFYKEIL